MKLLDEKGLTTVWAAIKNTFTSKSDADEKYAEKSKALGSINFDYTAWGLNMSTYNVDGDGCGYINITPATSKIAGVMTASDKAKLDGIATGANNYTLPIASDTVLGGIKTGYNKTPTGNRFPVELDNEGNAFTLIGGLLAVNGCLKRLNIEDGSYTTIYASDIQKINTDSNKKYSYSFPLKSGTFALTSDIPNVSGLGKFNIVSIVGECKIGKMNFMADVSGTIYLDGLRALGEGAILILSYADIGQICDSSNSWYYNAQLYSQSQKKSVVQGQWFIITVKDGTIRVLG